MVVLGGCLSNFCSNPAASRRTGPPVISGERSRMSVTIVLSGGVLTAG